MFNSLNYIKQLIMKGLTTKAHEGFSRRNTKDYPRLSALDLRRLARNIFKSFSLIIADFKMQIFAD